MNGSIAKATVDGVVTDIGKQHVNNESIHIVLNDNGFSYPITACGSAYDYFSARLRLRDYLKVQVEISTNLNKEVSLTVADKDSVLEYIPAGNPVELEGVVDSADYDHPIFTFWLNCSSKYYFVIPTGAAVGKLRRDLRVGDKLKIRVALMPEISNVYCKATTLNKERDILLHQRDSADRSDIFL